MKKYLLLLFCLVLSLMASAESGKCGDNLTWTLENGTLTISGMGAMTEYSSTSAIPWYSSRSSISTVVINEGVTSIGKYAFSGCSALTSITIPNSVTSIGNWAFDGCSSLPVIDNVRYADCVAVEAIDKNQSAYVIKEGTRFIYSYAFYNCSGLTSITIPNSVTSIGDYAFRECSSLTSITIPNSVTSIGDHAFSGCSRLTSVIIPNSVTSIGGSAFSYCSGLTSITIPNSVTSIGTNTFERCSNLTSVNVSCKDMDDFSDYIQRTDIASVFHVYELQYKAYNIYIAGTLQTEITIPNSVTSIGGHAFYGCSGLTSITIPNSVTSIGDYAFRECSSLTSITIPNSVTSIGNSAFYNCARLISIYVNCTTPPNCGNSSTFECSDTRDKYDVYDYTTLHVPMGSGEAYASAYEWRYFKKIKEDMDIDGTTYYTTLEINQGNEGYVKHYVKADDTYTVYIGVDGDSKINTILYNGEDVTDRLVDGYFTTPAIKHASRLCVSFEQNLSGISSQNLSDIRVYGNDGKLYISGVDTNEDMSIYDLNGKLIKSSRIDGDTCVEISGGTYIVRIGSRTFKVSM